jgi:YVTN family beta-propeller protein
MPYCDYKKNLRSRYFALLILLAPFLALLLFSSPVHADGGFPIIGVLHAGQRPEGITVDTQTHMVYIAYEFPSFVVGFDPIRGKVRWRVPTGDSATDVQVDITNHRVYTISIARSGETGSLTAIDGGSGKILFTANTAAGDDGLAIDTQRQRAYVASSDAGIIDVFSLTTSPTGKISALSSTLKVGLHPQAIGVNSRLGRLYVGDRTAHTVTVVDEDSGHTLATIPVAATPVQPLRVDETNGRVYVVCSTGQELDVIDGHTNKVTARVPVSPYPEGIASNTATGRIYVADEGNKETNFNDASSGTTISVIDGQSFEVLGTLQVGRAPDGVASDPALRRIYVAVEDSDAVVEISDSPNLPLQSAPNFHQAAAIHQAILLLQEATALTAILMILTIVGATLGARSRRWHAPEIPQIPQGGASSRLEQRIPPA